MLMAHFRGGNTTLWALEDTDLLRQTFRVSSMQMFHGIRVCSMPFNPQFKHSVDHRASLTARQLILVLALTFGCVVSGRGMSMDREIASDLVLTLPDGVTMSSDSPVEDFVLYNFSNQNGKRLLSAYMGNQPKQLELPNGARSSSVALSGLSGDFFQWSDPSGAKYGAVRVKVRNNGWPCWLQFSYGPLDEGAADLALQIIHSLHRSQRNLPRN
jgi:hypothetical protein